MSELVRWPVPRSREGLKDPSSRILYGLVPDTSQATQTGLIDQSGVTFSPQINLRLALSLIDQSGVVFAPEIVLTNEVFLLTTGGPEPSFDKILGSRIVSVSGALVLVEPGFIDQVGVVFAPQINLGASIGIIDQAGVTFEPSVSGGGGLSVAPGLIDQAGLVFSPQINQSVAVGFIDQAGAVFSPQINQSVAVGLIDQAGIVFAPTRVFVSKVSPPLIDNTGVTFDPSISGGVEAPPSRGITARMRLPL